MICIRCTCIIDQHFFNFISMFCVQMDVAHLTAFIKIKKVFFSTENVIGIDILLHNPTSAFNELPNIYQIIIRFNFNYAGDAYEIISSPNYCQSCMYAFFWHPFLVGMDCIKQVSKFSHIRISTAEWLYDVYLTKTS